MPLRNELRLSLSPSLLPAAGALMLRLRHALDLDADPSLIDPCLAAMPVPPRAGLRVPGALDGFETAVRIILGQQVTVAAARTLAQRLVAEFGQPIETPFAGLDRLFPGAADIADGRPGAHRPAGHRAPARGRAAGAGARGGRRAHRTASRSTADARRWTRCARCPASANGRCS